MKKLLLRIFAITMLVSVFHTCNEPYDPSMEPLELQQNPGFAIAIEKVQDVMDLQDRVTDALFRNPEVVGTGTGLNENGNPAIVVYTLTKVQQRADINIQNIGQGAYPTALPVSIENVPVVAKVTGMFKAYADPAARFPRPVPIGVSTGHPDITAGTIGCRVKDANGNIFALSNNHVFANINKASIGDNILQPGPYDGGTDPADAIGTLYDYEPMDFNGGNNFIDAAIALSSESELNYATPSGDGYGTPSSTIVSATVKQKVQKYGRTTVWTKGEVSEINVTVNVCYESAGPFRCKTYATFVNQIGITPGTFSAGGDSGSLIVTDDGNNYPVGLLFAGSDARTLANPIQPVLERFSVTIDDGSGGGGGDGTTNNSPTADFAFTTTDLNVDFTDQSTDSDGTLKSWSWDFGDNSGTSTAQNPSYTYASDGTYTVILTVTDDDGATDSSSQDVTVTSSIIDGGITLTATGYKVKGRQHVDLKWSGATSTDVDVYIDGNVHVTTPNDGFYTYSTNNVGGGSYTFKVCESGTSTCSGEVTVTF